MKFSVRKTSEIFSGKTTEKEINTLEELMDFVRECNTEVVILKSDKPTLEIYDDYRE